MDPGFRRDDGKKTRWPKWKGALLDYIRADTTDARG